jgi:hypothetical protein
VAVDSKTAATLALLQDWWTAWQQADHDPTQEVIVLAARRVEVDRLNTACQEVLAGRGRLGAERLQVEDRHLAVGDRVVCGKNSIQQLGVANGSRGTITALDSHDRTLTLRLDGTNGRTVVLPRSYLEGRGRGMAARRGRERRTARLLGPLERQGWAILHDLALPGSRANIDHLMIGPGGMFVVDSKQYRGRLQLDGSGRPWHGRYPLAPAVRAVSWEADQAAQGARFPGARSPRRVCRWWRPGGCQACCVLSQRC